MNLNTICDRILDANSSPQELHAALDTFSRSCSEVTGIWPDPSFDAWADDSLLENGVAINPQAAAHCAYDYQRSVVFIRGVYAAINSLKKQFPTEPIEVLYAGCGPFATLLLPLLGRFAAGDLSIHLLDIHQRSIDSVELLLAQFELQNHAAHTIKDDACHYQHPNKLHLIIAETMQKSLEQEPQFAVTANLAPQLLPTGIFIPQSIEVDLCLTELEREKEQFDFSGRLDSQTLEKRYQLAKVFTLSAEYVVEQLHRVQPDAATEALALNPTSVVIPSMPGVAQLDAALFTRITVFEQHRLEDYESEITLPLRCHEILPLVAGQHYRVSYQLSSYPKFNFEKMSSE